MPAQKSGVMITKRSPLNLLRHLKHRSWTDITSDVGAPGVRGLHTNYLDTPALASLPASLTMLQHMGRQGELLFTAITSNWSIARKVSKAHNNSNMRVCVGDIVVVVVGTCWDPRPNVTLSPVVAHHHWHSSQYAAIKSNVTNFYCNISTLQCSASIKASSNSQLRIFGSEIVHLISEAWHHGHDDSSVWEPGCWWSCAAANYF